MEVYRGIAAILVEKQALSDAGKAQSILDMKGMARTDG
jgi:hypothetical protein